MWDRPLRTIEDAETYFVAMGCSPVQMAREYPDRYREYLALRISHETETMWRVEQFELARAVLEAGVEREHLWWTHARMADLIRMLGTRVAVEQGLIVTQSIRNTVPSPDRVMVAETINGRAIRKVHSGLIYFAYDLGLGDIAREFAALSRDFAAYRAGETRDLVRCLRAMHTCAAIMQELGFVRHVRLHAPGNWRHET